MLGIVCGSGVGGALFVVCEASEVALIGDGAHAVWFGYSGWWVVEVAQFPAYFADGTKRAIYFFVLDDPPAKPRRA